MAKKPCNFPNSLDNLVEDRKPGDVVTSDSYDVIESAINALERKVGINGSLDPNSHEYKIAHKPNKPPSSTAGNLASLDSNGNLQDSGYKPTDFTTQDDISNKANKVLGAVNDNFVALKSDGDIKDSGKKAADFANVVHTHTGADIISEVSNADMVDGKHASEFEPVIPIKGTAFNKDFGTAEDTVCEGNDERLYDDRPPTPHAPTHITGGSDTIPDADLEGNSGLMTSDEKQKLNNATADNIVNTLVLRNNDGIINISDPVNPSNAATKNYVDTQDWVKVDKIIGGTSGNLAELIAGGNITDSGKKVSDFAESTHASTHKGDGADAIDTATTTVSGLMSSTDKKKLDDATATDIASTLVMRDTNKRAKFADPAENQDAATKKYVDDSVSGKANKVSSPTTDNFASLKSDGDIQDSGKKASDFAEKNFKTATITTTWSGTSAPYTQDVAISGMTSDNKPVIAPVYSDTLETAIAQQTAWNLIDKIVTDEDKITCYCFTDKPEVEIPIQLWVV